MSSEFSMFIKSIKRNYLKVLADESIPDGEKIDALISCFMIFDISYSLKMSELLNKALKIV